MVRINIAYVLTYILRVFDFTIGQEKDPMVSNLPQPITTPTVPALSQGSLSPVKTPPAMQRMEEDDTG